MSVGTQWKCVQPFAAAAELVGARSSNSAADMTRTMRRMGFSLNSGPNAGPLGGNRVVMAVPEPFRFQTRDQRLSHARSEAPSLGS